MKKKQFRHEQVVAGVLIFCLLVVMFWEVMSRWSRRPYDGFQLSASDFMGFRVEASGWKIGQRDVVATPTEPEILKYDFRPLTQMNRATTVLPSPAACTVHVRLVHGYNMVDCMRIKGYTVKRLPDRAVDMPLHVELWQLMNSVGDISIWVTSMLKAGDFSPVNISTTDMPFPKVGIPDNPNWLPRGLTWSSFKEPGKNMRLFLRSKWNASRCDPFVFLRLKQPVWVDDESLTLVSDTMGTMFGSENDEAVVGSALEAHKLMYMALKAWSEQRCPQ